MAAYDFEMTFDAADGYVLLLGAVAGTPGTGAVGATQTWSFHAGNWTRLHPASHPSNCPGSALSYDDVDHYVVYLAGPNWPGSGGIRCSSANQTWTFAGGNWTQLHPTSTPSGRYGAALTNDTKDGYLVLFGGMTPSGLWNDTWKFVGGNWTQLHPRHAPSPREEAGLAYDAADGYVLLFGGVDSHRGPPGLNDSWRYRGGTWTLLTLNVSPPGPEPDAFSFDAADREVVYTTAENWSGPLTEISWTYRGGVWSQVTSSGALIPGVPIERLGCGTAMDYGDGYVLFFGGLGWNDSWSFQKGTWSELSPPPARTGEVLVDDPAAGFVLMFGGTNGQWALNDSWAWSNGSWRFLSTPVSPPARAFASAAYDPTLGGVLLFGGMGCYGPFLGWMGSCTGERNDTWEFVGGAWSAVAVHGSPLARAAAAMAYDPRGHVIALFGGYSGTGFLRDTWRWTNGTWSIVRPVFAPSARAGAAAAYDPKAAAIVLFGGIGRKSAGQTVLLNDTWSYHGGSWTALTPTASPPARANASLTFDPKWGGLFLFGGSGTIGQVFGDTWEFAGGTWASVTMPVAPAARASSALAFASQSREAVLFGGLSSTVSVIGNGGTWRLR